MKTSNTNQLTVYWNLFEELLTALQGEMTTLYVHRKLNKVHLTGSRYPHISKVENLSFAVNQHQLIGGEHFVVVGVCNISVWEPNALNISPPERQCSTGSMCESFIDPLLAKINVHLEFLKWWEQDERSVCYRTFSKEICAVFLQPVIQLSRSIVLHNTSKFQEN